MDLPSTSAGAAGDFPRLVELFARQAARVTHNTRQTIEQRVAGKSIEVVLGEDAAAQLLVGVDRAEDLVGEPERRGERRRVGGPRARERAEEDDHDERVAVRAVRRRWGGRVRLGVDAGLPPGRIVAELDGKPPLVTEDGKVHKVVPK